MLRRIAMILFRTTADRALEQEIAFHLEQETAKNIALGMTPDEARRQARIAFGSIAATQEAHRDGRRVHWLDEVIADTRYAFRQMRRAPVFTAVAVAVLAIGIGVNSAVFAFVDGILHPRPRGIDSPEALVRVNLIPREGAQSSIAQQFNELLEFRDAQQVFLAVGAYTSRAVVAGAGLASNAKYAAFVTGDYFAVVRPRMALGRPFPASDDRARVPDASVVISHDYWRTEFGRDSSVIGRDLLVNGVRLAVVGVLPERVTGLGSNPHHDAPDLMIPYATRSLLFVNDSAFIHRRASSAGFMITARLKPSATVVDAKREVARVAPPCVGRRCLGASFEQVRPLLTFEQDDAAEVVQAGAVVGILTGLMLIVACANVSILLLGRAVMRRREIAVRLSLGAGRARLIRQLITESAVLAIVSSGLGLLILRWSGNVIRSQFSELGVDLSPSWRIVALSVAFAAGTGMLFGLLPALHATRSSVSDAIKEGTGSSDRARSRLQRTFVVAEVAISVTLVCTTGLFVQAAWRYVARPAGYTISESVLLSAVPLSQTRHSAQSAAALLTAVRDRVAEVPGVAAASLTNVAPVSSMEWAHGFVQVDGALKARSMVGLVDADYFAAIGISVRAGRSIETTDIEGAAPVAVVSRNLADLLWPGGTPIGRTISFARVDIPDQHRDARDELLAGRQVMIVGVVDSVGRGYVSNDRYMVYLPRRQVPVLSDFSLIVRVNQAPHLVVKRVMEAMRSVDATFPFTTFASTKELASRRDSEMKQTGQAAALAGLIALVLAGVGLFAIVAFSVAQRTREIGIRIALGATQRQVVARFFSDGMRLALIGFAIGVPVATAVMRVLWAQVLGVGTLDPWPMVAIVLVLLTVAALASWVPARRATGVDPIKSLRSE